MIDGNVHTRTERYDAVSLQWANRVDAFGGRIEWCITTDDGGWTCSYGPVCNQGILFGSRAIQSQADEQALLAELRDKARHCARPQVFGGSGSNTISMAA